MLTGLVLRLIKGSPLTSLEGDQNLTKIRDAFNALEQLFGVVLNTNGTLKAGAVNASTVLADGVVTNAKLAADAKTPAGTVAAYAGTTVPTGWLECDGSAVARQSGGVNTALFTAIGTLHGAGDGVTTYNLPNARRRTVFGSGGSGTAVIGNTVGNVGGAETHTLATTEIPSHTHTIAFGTPAVTDVWAFATTGNSDGTSSGAQMVKTTLSNSNTGGGGAHNNIQPSIIMMWIIKT